MGSMGFGLRHAAVAFVLVAAATTGAGCKKEGVFYRDLAPRSGRASGGEEVRLLGSGFRALGSLEIRVGPKPATNVGIADDETIVLTTPEAREADLGHPLDIYILTNTGHSYVLRGAFTYRRGQADTPGGELQRRL
jgi:hypothetical protein